MSTLAEFQFELLPGMSDADGFVFGIGADVSTDENGFHPGATAWATQNSQSPNGTVNFGRDQLQGPVWAWDLFVNGEEVEDAAGTLAAATAAWRAMQIRLTPGAVLPLRYQFAGQTRRIYGRPGNFEPTMNNLVLNGFVPITCDFQAVDGYTYNDAYDTISLSLNDSDEGAGGGGFIFPVILPTNSAIPTEQVGSVAAGGDAETGLIVRFNGPITSPSLSTDNWTLSLPDYAIPTGQYVEIDTRPWANTVLLNGVTSVAGALARRIRLNDIRLQPGSIEARFNGVTTGIPSCTLTWASAWNSI